MKRYQYLTYILLGVFLFRFAAVQAAENLEGERRIVWSKKPNNSGLYTERNFFSSRGISINGNAMYYFGDVDNVGVAFNGGFNNNNVSYGGSFAFAFISPASAHCNLRISLLAGGLGGNNTEKFLKLKNPRLDSRSFKSVIIQPAFGVEIYPASNAGFYIYAGVAVTASIITDYKFKYYEQVGDEKVLKEVQGSTFGILPMVQLGIGYNWRLNDSWAIGLELMGNEGVIDTHYMNLDGWPMAASQNSAGVELGKTFGVYKDDEGNKHIHWNDGWFQLGIKVTYLWNTCDKCRIINNYKHVRPQRRNGRY